MDIPMTARRTLGLRAVSLGMATVGAVALMITVATSARAGAFPHLKLLKSSPVADTTLNASPDAIRLWLSEPAELPGTKISLATESGTAVETAPLTRAAASDAPVVAKITKPLTAGAYTVTWKAMSKDGHVINNSFGFKVHAK